MVLLFGHAVYRGLVLEAGWSIVTYKAWLFSTAVQQLLGRTRLAPTAIADLSFGGEVTGAGSTES